MEPTPPKLALHPERKMLELPKISIVTPCLNQVAYIGKTLLSIHGQDYPNLEHVVMDGGSTDGCLDVIKRYSDRLRWVSEPDGGQYQAIAKGFERTTGEVMAWLNSDDMYLPGALRVVGEIFRDYPEVEWITTRFPMAIDGTGAIIKVNCFPGFSWHHFLRGDNLPACGWEAMGFIQQESTFWRRGLWEKAGSDFSENMNYASDFDLWSRFFQHALLYGVDVPLGCFRRHETQKTSVAFDKYLDEAKDAWLRTGGKVPPALLQKTRIRLLGACGTSPEWRRLARKIGLLKGTNNITYDWGRRCWVKEL